MQFLNEVKISTIKPFNAVTSTKNVVLFKNPNKDLRKVITGNYSTKIIIYYDSG